MSSLARPAPALILILFVVLALGGLVVLASASESASAVQYGDSLQMLKQHLLRLGLGVVIMALLLCIPLDMWRSRLLQFFAVGGTLSLLFLVLIHGEAKNGSTRWLDLGFAHIQPSELAKFALPLLLAAHCARLAEEGRIHLFSWREFFHFFLRFGFLNLFSFRALASSGRRFWLWMQVRILFFLAAGLIILMIFWEPDLGTAVLLFAVMLGTFFIARMSLAAVMGWFAIGGTLGWLVIQNSEYRMARMKVMWDPFIDAEGSGYQSVQSMIAFGRGGFFGQGLGESVQKRGRLPEAHNDYVLSIVAEEMGVVAVALVLLIFLLVALRSFSLAASFLRQKEYFRGYLVSGIALLVFWQVLLHAGVAMAAPMPPTGISLPFFSTGGSNLLVMMVLFALLIRAEYEWRVQPSQYPTRLEPKRMEW